MSAKPLRFRLNDVSEAHALLFPIANGDDALAFAIPFEVISVFFYEQKRKMVILFHESRAKRVRKRTTYILPVITLYSPLSA